MTANFSFNRLLQLVGKQWVENRRLYIISVLALTGILGICFVLWIIFEGSRHEESTTYIFGITGLFITGTVYASTTYNMLNAKDTGIYWISFPASHLEKFLVTLFFNLIVFVVVYALIFFGLKFISEAYIQYAIDHKIDSVTYNQVQWSQNKGFAKTVVFLANAFFPIQAAFLLGAVSFKRFSFIITVVITTGFLLFYGWVSYKFAAGAFGKGTSFDFFTLRIFGDKSYKEYEINSVLKTAIEIFVRYLIAPFLWLITWYKLKEKQI